MTRELTASEALDLRMTSLLLRPHPSIRPGDVAGVVQWFGAMQAQDLASGLWSFGARLPGQTVVTCRRRWSDARHCAPGRCAAPFTSSPRRRALDAGADRRTGAGRRRHPARAARADRDRRRPRGERPRQRRWPVAAGYPRAVPRRPGAAGIGTAGQRGYHLLWYARPAGLTCVAPTWAPNRPSRCWTSGPPEPRRPERDEALALLAHRYFRGHGPATAPRFRRLDGSDRRRRAGGLAAADALLSTVRVDGEPMYVDAALARHRPAPGGRHARAAGLRRIPARLRDRSLMLDPAHQAAVVPGNNGIFQATVVRSGRVVGVWKRKVARAAVTVTVQPLTTLDAAARARVEQALGRYADFLGLPPRFDWLT